MVRIDRMLTILIKYSFSIAVVRKLQAEHKTVACDDTRIPVTCHAEHWRLTGQQLEHPIRDLPAPVPPSTQLELSTASPVMNTDFIHHAISTGHLGPEPQPRDIIIIGLDRHNAEGFYVLSTGLTDTSSVVVWCFTIVLT